MAPISAQDIFPSVDDGRFARLGDGHYQLTAETLVTDLELSHVRRERHQLYGELVVHCGLSGVATVNSILFTATINLSSLRDRESVARALCDRTRSKDPDAWKALVDELAIRVQQGERDGDPGVELATVPARSTLDEHFHRAHGFRLPDKLPSMLFGDGDSLKTMTADAIAIELARKGIKTGIVDAEMTVDEHRDRVEALHGGAVPSGVYYLAASRALVYDRDRVAEFIRRYDLRYLVFDSVAFLCHDKPETADAAMSYFRAVRSLGPIGSLHIAHTTKGEDGDQKPFGSAFWFNSVRALWYAKRAEMAVGATSADIGYYPRKFNLGTRPAAHAIRFIFDQRRIRLESIEPTTVETLAAALPLKERIRTILRTGARTVTELGAELPDVDAETLSRTIRRYTGDRAKFQVFSKLDDGRFGLVERRRP